MIWSKLVNSLSNRAPSPMYDGTPARARYDFAVAYPDPATIPLDDMIEGLADALRIEGKDLAIYPHPKGYPPLREFVSEKLLRDRDINVTPEQIILTDGSSEPIHILTEIFVDPGDVVLVEDFVYPGTLRTLRRFRADIRGITCDSMGMDPNSLEETIEKVNSEGKKTKLIYTIPTFQNPQGWTMTVGRREALIEISQRQGIPILEDDCYVDLRYEGEKTPSIYSLDDSGSTMYVGSFSKILAPGMRMGYVAADAEVIARALAAKSGGGVNQFAALAIHKYATSGLDEHVHHLVEIQTEKRDAMLSALGETFGSSGTWSRPQGSLYIWLQMAGGVDLEATTNEAFEAEVGYLPGPMFAPDGVSGKNFARLCYGYNTPEEIREGIERLGKVLEQRGDL